jgi:hypothetical protein
MRKNYSRDSSLGFFVRYMLFAPSGPTTRFCSKIFTGALESSVAYLGSRLLPNPDPDLDLGFYDQE